MVKKLNLNFWSNNLKLLWLLSIVLCLSKSQAQNTTFMYTFKNSGGYDILEDKKNGFVFNADYSIFRINKFGNKLFEQYKPGLWMILETSSDSNSLYIFGVSSEIGGYAFNKIDYSGKLLEENYYSDKDNNDTLITPQDVIFDEKRDQFVVCGGKNPYYSTKYHFWIAGVDKNGKILWQNSFFDKGKFRHFSKIIPNKATGGYLLLGSDIMNNFYSEIFNTDSLGHLISRNYVDSCYDANFLTYRMEVVDISPFQDSLFLVSGRTSCNRDLNYYILDKYGKTKRKIISDFNSELFIPLDNGNIFFAVGDYIYLLDQNFNLVWMREKLFGEHLHFYYEIHKLRQSKDGGFYGIAEGIAPSGEDNLVFVFKTDRDGLIHPQNKYSEWDQPLMLIPNPASKKVRIAIPYYYGQIEAHFFDSKGNLISKQIQNDTDLFDIQHLSPGMYFVKAVILNTQESRTMKLIVE